MALTQIDTEALARKILLHSRRRISHVAPVLLESIYALPEKVSPLPGPLATDSKTLWFCPEQVVDDFPRDQDSVARQLLHVTLHCLLEFPAQIEALFRNFQARGFGGTDFSPVFRRVDALHQDDTLPRVRGTAVPF